MTTSTGCSRCGCLTYDQEWETAFGVRLCTHCKRDEDLISKGNAKELYLVTDADFKKLGSVAKANPKHKDWTPMRLYLESQVQELASTKYGGEEGIEERRTKQNTANADRRAKKRAKQADQDGKEDRKLQRIRDRIEGEAQGTTGTAEKQLAAAEEEEL